MPRSKSTALTRSTCRHLQRRIDQAQPIPVPTIFLFKVSLLHASVSSTGKDPFFITKITSQVNNLRKVRSKRLPDWSLEARKKLQITRMPAWICKTRIRRKTSIMTFRNTSTQITNLVEKKLAFSLKFPPKNSWKFLLLKTLLRTLIPRML